jgi:hypothetical protein
MKLMKLGEEPKISGRSYIKFTDHFTPKSSLKNGPGGDLSFTSNI